MSWITYGTRHVCLWNFMTLYGSGLMQWLIFIPVKLFTEVSMANHYYSICDFLHLFMEWQKSPSSVKECSNWQRHQSLSKERSLKLFSTIDWLDDKVWTASFPLSLNEDNKHLSKMLWAQAIKTYRNFLIENSPYLGICENIAHQKVSTLLLYKHWQLALPGNCSRWRRKGVPAC